MDCLCCSLSGLRSRSGVEECRDAGRTLGEAGRGRRGLRGLKALWRGQVTVRLGSGWGHVGPLGFQGGLPWSGRRRQKPACSL